MMKNKQRYATAKFTGMWVVMWLLLLFGGSVIAQELTQGYKSDTTLIRGQIVAQNEEDSTKVERINLAQLDRMFGVVVRANDSPLRVNDEENGIFIATKGRFEVLVTDVNGTINEGDFITLSALDAIGMKADEKQKLIIGTALQKFDVTNTNNILSQIDVKADNGEVFKAAVGRILVDIEVRPNPIAEANQAVPAFLANLANNVAQKPVSTARIYAALGILMIASAVAASLLYSVVRSAIISIGRNPLSKKSVLRGVFQVIFISILIFIAGLFAVYLVLKF